MKHSNHQTQNDVDFECETISNTPQLISQSRLSDLVRDLELHKGKSELLASRLRQWNLLDESAKITIFRHRHTDFVSFFKKIDCMIVCDNVQGLMSAMGIEYHVEQWRLFIDSSKVSLKAVLLHNGNELPSIPVAHATHMKETYENIKLVLESINYDNHQWHLCGDLKVVAFLLGLQQGLTKFSCFLCEWDSRARSLHYVTKDWPVQRFLKPGEKNVQHKSLVDPTKILLPPLHIKLGLMKNLVKAMDKNGPAFLYLSKKFPRLSEAKIKEGVFIGPQIRDLFKDAEFDNVLSGNEKERNGMLSVW